MVLQFRDHAVFSHSGILAHRVAVSAYANTEWAGGDGAGQAA